MSDYKYIDADHIRVTFIAVNGNETTVTVRKDGEHWRVEYPNYVETFSTKEQAIARTFDR